MEQITTTELENILMGQEYNNFKNLRCVASKFPFKSIGGSLSICWSYLRTIWIPHLLPAVLPSSAGKRFCSILSLTGLNFSWCQRDSQTLENIRWYVSTLLPHPWILYQSSTGWSGTSYKPPGVSHELLFLYVCLWIRTASCSHL